MAELLVRDVEPAILARLKKRADEHRRSIEDEHRAILRDVLLADERETAATTFEAYLRKMPDVGTDADFSRIEGSIRDANLAE
jgi:plasmid stability protein